MVLPIGIDPGLSGAIAAITSDGNIELHDCPILTIGTKSKYNPAQMAVLLRQYQESYPALLVGLDFYIW